MKPTYAVLKANHYSSNELNSSYVSRKDIYQEIGYDDEALMKQNPGYYNTCATRMSMALIKSGVAITGRLKIKDGAYKGRTFEPGAKLLADELSKPNLFGKPQIFTGAEAQAKLAGKKGVVFFWKIENYSGGHIDMIETANSVFVCNSACSFNSKEVWFWPLD